MGAQAFFILPCLLGLPYYNVVGYITPVVFYTHQDTRDRSGYTRVLNGPSAYTLHDYLFSTYLPTYLPTQPPTYPS